MIKSRTKLEKRIKCYSCKGTNFKKITLSEEEYQKELLKGYADKEYYVCKDCGFELVFVK